MATTVTVPGAQLTKISETYSSQSALGVANQIAAVLAAAQTANTLSVYDYASPGSVPTGNVGELAVTTPGGANVTVGSGFSYVAIDQTVTGAVTISGAANLFAGSQDITYLGTAGSNLNLVLGSGNNLVSLAHGSTYTVSFDNPLLLAETAIATPQATDTIYANGSGSVYGGTGTNLIFSDSAGGNNVIFSQGTADTVIAGAGNSTISLSGFAASVWGGSGFTDIFGNSSDDTTISGGSGSLQYVGGSTNATVFGGTGTETLFGGAGQDLTYFDGSTTAPGANFLAAGSGAETLDASKATVGVDMAAGSGSAVILGSSGADTFFGGSGQATITGNGGSDLYAFGNTTGHTGGSDVITDWNSSDLFVTIGYGANAAQDALNAATVAGGATTVQLADNTTITFENITDPTKINNYSFPNVPV